MHFFVLGPFSGLTHTHDKQCVSFLSKVFPSGVDRYMNAAKVGEDILITTQVLKQGRTLGFATVDLINKANGKLIAQGRHTKHLGS